MALHIEDPEIVAEVEAQSKEYGISPEEVVRRALAERRKRYKERYDDIIAFLDASGIPEGGKPMTKEDEAEILGYGPDGIPPP